MQRVLTDVGRAFDPLERIIRETFLPALIGIPANEIDGDYRDLLTHSVKLGRISIRNPTETSAYNIETSMATTKHLVDSLVDGIPFNQNGHRRAASSAGKVGRIARLARERGTLTCRGENDPAKKRRDMRACLAGAWLLVYPSDVNGTGLSSQQIRYA